MISSWPVLTGFATDVSLHEMLLNVCAKWMLQRSTKSTWTCRTMGFLGLVSLPVVDGTLVTKRPTELLRFNGVSIFLVFPKIHVLGLGCQEVLHAVTTSAEGTFSVLSRLCNIWRAIPWIESWSNHYLHYSLCWPGPRPLWENVSGFCGPDVDTIVLAANVRLPCMLPAPWISGQTLQATWVSLMSRGCRSSFQQAEFGRLPMATISHTISHSMYLNSRAVSILASYQSAFCWL